MDHQPYENWLLNDERLTAEQERDLRLHLRNCPDCAALSRANMALRSAPMAAPPAGFVPRLQVRLAAQRKAQRLRNIFSLTLIFVIGMSILLIVVPPYLVYLSSSPAQLAATWITNLVYFGVTLQDVNQNSGTALDMIAAFVPLYIWGLSFALVGGTGLLWFLSSRRFAKLPQAMGQENPRLPADEA